MQRGILLLLLFILVFLSYLSFSSAISCTEYPIEPTPLLEPHKNTTKFFRIGSFGSFNIASIGLSVMRLIIFYINNSTEILSDVLLELHHAELTISTEPSTAALIATQTLIKRDKVRAIVGGVYTAETRTGQLYSRVYKIPQIAPSSLGSVLSNKIEFPFLARVIPPDTIQAQAIASLIRHYDWKQVMLIYGDDEYGTYGLDNVRKVLDDCTLYTFQVPASTINFTVSASHIADYIDRFNVRIFIMYTPMSIGSPIMQALSDLGYINSSYVYILTYSMSYTAINEPSLYPNYHFLDGAIGLSPSGATKDGIGKLFFDLWGSTNETEFPGIRPFAHTAWYCADAVLSIAHGLDKLLKSGMALEDVTGTDLLESIKTVNFTGVTGQITFDRNTDRIGNYMWFNIVRGRAETNIPIAEYSPITRKTSFFSALKFYGGVTSAYDGVCYCFQGTCNRDGTCNCPPGFSGPLCDNFQDVDNFGTAEIILVIVLPVIFVVFLLFASAKFLKYKRTRMIKELAEQQRSIIKREDIVLQNRIGRGASGEVFKAMLRGTEVAVKRLVTGSTTKAAIEEFELECAIMAGLRHPNIVLFIGNCFVPEQKELLLVLELMERGSLNDIINNPLIRISKELSLNIAYQAAKGMHFLHKSVPPIIHRDLKSHNILLDEKWNARIADFGITKVKNLKESKQNKEPKPLKHNSLGTIYWTAPEVFEGKQHTEASDCYSFGIVLWELWHRKIPYNGQEPMIVALKVCSPLNLRPELDYSISPEVRDLITNCWEANPESRPTFEEIMERLKTFLNPHSGVSNLSGPQVKNNNNNSNHDSEDSEYSSEGERERERDRDRDRDYFEVEAPTGVVYFVQTFVERANELWDNIPMPMLDAMLQHNKVMRKNIGLYGGYEVEEKNKNTSNSNTGFFIAFSTLASAIHWCLACQKELLLSLWSNELLSHPACKTVKGEEGNYLWNGLRVRMSVHTGVPNCDIDKSSGRMFYFGSVVKRAKKLLLATTQQFSIIISSSVLEYINTRGVIFSEELLYEETKDTTKKEETIYKVLPKSLCERTTTNVFESSSNLPHTIISVNEIESDNNDDNNNDNNNNYNKNKNAKNITVKNNKKQQKNKKPASVILKEEIEEKETVGKGAVGEYHKCIWKGQEVAMKLLTNQKLDEFDFLTLLARSSILTKIRHKNIVDFYGVCLTAGNIATIVEYLPNRGLPSFLSDSSFHMDFNLKLRIARQIAEGMDFISTQKEYNWIAIHATFKSSNIILNDKNMTVKISDVGQGNLKDLSRTMTSVGSVAWTAPELLSGEEPNPEIAIYGFGIILWELFTRKIPYLDQHPIRVVNEILAGFRPPVPLECPSKYSKLMEQCWHADPEKRPSWKQVISQLQEM